MAPSLQSSIRPYTLVNTILTVILCLGFDTVSNAFAPANNKITKSKINTFLSHQMKISFSPHHTLSMTSSPNNDNLSGVIDLTDEDEEDSPPTILATNTPTKKQVIAPFLSQGELSDDPNLLSPDFKDTKQTRVIIYIILTLVPILFLVPLMIGSRDLIPLDALPPVELN